MVDIDTQEALDAVIEDWRHGKLVAKRHIARMDCTIAIVRKESGRFDVLRAFPLGGVPQLSVDAHEATEAEAFTALLRVID